MQSMRNKMVYLKRCHITKQRRKRTHDMKFWSSKYCTYNLWESAKLFLDGILIFVEYLGLLNMILSVFLCMRAYVICQIYPFCNKNSNSRIIFLYVGMQSSSFLSLSIKIHSSNLRNGGIGVYEASLVAQTVKNPCAMQEAWVWSLGQEDPLEKGITTQSSIHAWRISWTEEPGKLGSIWEVSVVRRVGTLNQRSFISRELIPNARRQGIYCTWIHVNLTLFWGIVGHIRVLHIRSAIFA